MKYKLLDPRSFLIPRKIMQINYGVKINVIGRSLCLSLCHKNP